MESKFKVDALTFKYKKTRRGVAATCKILDLEGNHVATLNDKPESIVAEVEFFHNDTAREFLCEAHTNLSPDSWVYSRTNNNDSVWVSEYARQITMEAELKLLK